MSSFLQWEHAENLLFHTENHLTEKFPQKHPSSWTILSIRKNSPISYWVYAESCLFHAEHRQKSLLNYTEHRLEAYLAFGKTKPPFTHLKRLFMEKPNQKAERGPRWTFSKQKFFLNLKFSSVYVYVYTEYMHNEPSLDPIGSIK